MDAVAKMRKNFRRRKNLSVPVTPIWLDQSQSQSHPFSKRTSDILDHTRETEEVEWMSNFRPILYDLLQLQAGPGRWPDPGIRCCCFRIVLFYPCCCLMIVLFDLRKVKEQKMRSQRTGKEAENIKLPYFRKHKFFTYQYRCTHHRTQNRVTLRKTCFSLRNMSSIPENTPEMTIIAIHNPSLFWSDPSPRVRNGQATDNVQ